MDELDVSATVERPPEEVYDALLDFRRYEGYSEYLRDVERVSGEERGVGAEYRLRFGWWKVQYDVRSRVTGTENPHRIEFELVRGIRANGEWSIEEAETGDGSASRVRFLVRYDPDSVAGDAVSLPTLVSLSWVVDRVEPLVEREARRVVEKMVADVEGDEREVDPDVTLRDGGQS